VKGVTGKRAVHLMDDEDRKKVPKMHEIWIDIGAKTQGRGPDRASPSATSLPTTTSLN